MSNTLKEVDTSDDEITMFDPFGAEEAKDASSYDDDIKTMPRKKDEKSKDAPENLVKATLSESEEVVLMDPFEEQASPKEEEEEGRTKVSDENDEEIEEITLVELESLSERKEGEVFLAPRSKDNDQGAIRRKRQRAKKVNFLDQYSDG